MPTINLTILSAAHDYFWKKYKNIAEKEFLTKDDDPNDLAMHVQKVVCYENIIKKCNLCGDFIDKRFGRCKECKALCFRQNVDRSIYFFVDEYRGFTHRIIFYLEDY